MVDGTGWDGLKGHEDDDKDDEGSGLWNTAEDFELSLTTSCSKREFEEFGVWVIISSEVRIF